MTKTREFFSAFFSKRMMMVFLLGFSSGLPFLLVGGTLKIWLTRAGVDISTIGYFSWVGIAYSSKFVWAPLLDRWSFFGMGRRRSWMLITQVALMIFIAILGSLEPQTSLAAMAAISVIIAFFGATQDIAIDAFRREILKDSELGIGSSMNIYGFRIAMLVSGGVGIGLVGTLPGEGLAWSDLYYIMAALMTIGIIVTLMAPEPAIDPRVVANRTFLQSVVDPFKQFLTRDRAVLILLFVFLFKLGDAMSAAMLNPFYVQMGYTNLDIGLIAKTFGLASSLVGIFFGGLILFYLGTYRSLWIFGILQALSTASFAIITYTGPLKASLAFAVIFEDISAGMGSAAFLAFLAQITDRRFTATQYAMLASIATLGRNFFSGFSGDMVKGLGWEWFFYICALTAIPGLLLIFPMKKITRQLEDEALAINTLKPG
ncbi:MAG: AmpG family muropeptide MFS transporter [Bdellovibrionota bacterium]